LKELNLSTEVSHTAATPRQSSVRPYKMKSCIYLFITHRTVCDSRFFCSSS
jgi:hypothetical protein